MKWKAGWGALESSVRTFGTTGGLLPFLLQTFRLRMGCPHSQKSYENLCGVVSRAGSILRIRLPHSQIGWQRYVAFWRQEGLGEPDGRFDRHERDWACAAHGPSVSATDASDNIGARPDRGDWCATLHKSASATLGPELTGVDRDGGPRP
jgi:hypothetical protein